MSTRREHWRHVQQEGREVAGAGHFFSGPLSLTEDGVPGPRGPQR